MLPDEGKQFLVLLRVPDVARVRLHRHYTEHTPVGLQGDSEPGRALVRGADQLDLTVLDQLERPRIRQKQWLPGSQDVGGCAPRVSLAERLPLVRVGEVDVDLVDVIRPADQLPRVVVQRDEEVVRVHQRADDGVHLAIELLQVARRARKLGDPVQRRLNLLGAAALDRRRHTRASSSRSTHPSIVRHEDGVQH